MSWKASPGARSVAGTMGLALAASLAGCADESRLPLEESAAFSRKASVTPSPVVTVTAGSRTLEFWPYTATDVSASESDPINLIFSGTGDVRAIRAALLGLSGDRTDFGFPDVAPFNCTWADAVGGGQTTWTAATGWTGSAIQLECGEFDQLRYHLRLFPAGDWVLANVHFELLVPGTHLHEVLSWEAAETLVMVDFIRSGHLAGAPSQTVPINPSPYRAINPQIFNMLPVELRGALGLPLTPQGSPVPIPSDGRATILPLGNLPTPDPMRLNRSFVVEFDQVIPKPLCATGPLDYIYVTGPITVQQRVNVTPSGNYISQFHAQGRLQIVPVNPLTNPPTPTGEPFHAIVSETVRSVITDRSTLVSKLEMQIMLPPTAPFRGRLRASFLVGPDGATHDSLRVECS